MKTDLVTVIEAILEERLDEIQLEWDDRHAVCVVMASGGYPETYEKGYPIKGLGAVKDGVVFHCGTRKDGDEIVTSGGRVLGIMAMGDTLEAARTKAYENVKSVQFKDAFYRKDIAMKIER